MSIKVCCPICHNGSEMVAPAPNWGEMRRCNTCGLVFANPMELVTTSEEFYTKAYNGELSVSDMQHFAKRMQHRKSLLRAHRFFPPQCTVLNIKWITHHLPKGATILDLGCGPGYFLYAARRNGYNPIGIEPGQRPATLLKQEGFEVWQGTLDNYPLDWPQPDAITCFFVLHHIPDPQGFLSTLRKRFPRATLLISDHHVNTRSAAGDAEKRTLPPRFLTWWTGQALKQGLVNAGYDPTVLELPYSIRQAFTLGIAVALSDTGTTLPAFLNWLFRGEKNSTVKSESPTSPHSTTFGQRFRRFTGIPWSLWAVAKPKGQ